MTVTTECCDVGQLEAGDVLVDRCGERSLASVSEVHGTGGAWIVFLVFTDHSWSWLPPDVKVERRVQL